MRDSHTFSPLTSMLQRGGRTEDRLDDYTFHCILNRGPFSLSGLSLDNMTTNPRRGYTRVSNVAQGFDRPRLRTRGLPLDSFTARGIDDQHLKVRSMEPNTMNGLGTGYYFSPVHDERLSGRSRIIDVMDEAYPARTGTRKPSMHNEGALPPYDYPGWDYYPWREQRPDRRRVTLSPNSGFRYRYEPQPQERQFRTIDRRPSSPRANGYRQANTNSDAHKEGALPFGKVMRWLHEGLVEVETFFKKFQDSYNNEVKAIEKYAGVEILQNLWVRKVTGKGAPQDDSQDKIPSEKWEERFAEKRTSLREAMEAALNASLSLGDQETAKVTTLESRKRLQEKVETAGHQVMDLLDLATKKSEHCKALLEELKLLKNLVDPKKRENKFLYDEFDGEAFGDGQGNGGSYDEQPTWEEN